MKTPWANVVLLILIVVQAITGYFGMVNGRISRAWILWAHGIGAYALLVLLYWKGGIILDAIRRKTVWTRRRIAFAGMLVLLLIVIGTGLLWTFNGPLYLGGFSLVSLHIYLAVPLLALMAWHAWQMRFIWRVPGTVGRRLFMGTAVSTLLGLVFWRTASLLGRGLRQTRNRTRLRPGLWPRRLIATTRCHAIPVNVIPHSATCPCSQYAAKENRQSAVSCTNPLRRGLSCK